MAGCREVQRAITLGETNKLASAFGIQDRNSLIAHRLERGLHVNREVFSLSPNYEDKREPRLVLHQPAEEGKESPRRGGVRQPLLGSHIEDVEFVEKNERADVVAQPLERREGETEIRKDSPVGPKSAFRVVAGCRIPRAIVAASS